MKPERWRQIEQLYDRALEMEESRRASFLREACAGDDDLRRELEQLLAEGRARGEFSGTSRRCGKLPTSSRQPRAHPGSAGRSVIISLCRWLAPGAWAKSIERAIRS